METPRNEVSNKCAATSLTFHLGETVCFSQSAGASERRSSISIPSIFGKRCAARMGFNGSIRRFINLTRRRLRPLAWGTPAKTTRNKESRQAFGNAPSARDPRRPLGYGRQESTTSSNGACPSLRTTSHGHGMPSCDPTCRRNRDRAKWFVKMDKPHYCLWWNPAGHIPTVAEGRERLEHYQALGATPYSFWFSQEFPKPTGDSVCA